MPVFHLHLQNSHIEADNVEGRYPRLDAAHVVAIEGIRDFLAHEAMNGLLDFRDKIDIEDEKGVVLQSIAFAEAFTIKGL